jgi:hypothetical protein
MAVVHDTVAVFDPDGGLITWKIMVRVDVVVPESVPGTSVALTPPRLAVILVALFALMVTMIIAARLAPLPITNAGVVLCVTLVYPKSELTALSNRTPTGLTVSDTVAAFVRPPPVPVIVNVEGPVGVLALVVIVSVEVVVAGFVLKVAVAPVGKPVTLRVT